MIDRTKLLSRLFQSELPLFHGSESVIKLPLSRVEMSLRIGDLTATLLAPQLGLRALPRGVLLQLSESTLPLKLYLGALYIERTPIELELRFELVSLTFQSGALVIHLSAMLFGNALLHQLPIQILR